ncbi:helicase A859L containing protein [Gemmatirosa kalamazoonensis]|uniref:Helicase A859L containing protein n=1 Tax=Gemmatirosa kalamazoonensis TaxID=861299 RepID=W0RMZ5_9BACT|nr:GIY-YIG nuclease family protein [Gemmatirosa kalamazoonensis]AHG91857.1 helicase A859L containing protein [Gemmatirosa kalamazoonensis]
MTGNIDLDALRADLAEFAEPAPEAAGSPLGERVLAGFDEIQRWVTEHGRLPCHGEGIDIFERLYAVRLDRIRAQQELCALLEPIDHHGILKGSKELPSDPATLSVDELAAQLAGIARSESEITTLRHVRSRAEIQSAEEIATRQPCADFEQFQPLFKGVQDEIRAGIRQTRRFGRDAIITVRDFFVLGGQLVYVAEMGEVYRTPEGAPNARLRVIYSNGTESNLLIRSLQNALYKDETGRRVTEPDAGPLFAAHADEGDLASGKVYVLRSRSDHPEIASRRDLIHKIGVTGGDVAGRIGNAKLDPTYLLADVEVVTTYQLYHINRTKLENLLHRVFDPARLSITLTDRFGNPVSPREWFLVPLFVIDEAIERIRDGTITDYSYDPAKGSLVRRKT